MTARSAKPRKPLGRVRWWWWRWSRSPSRRQVYWAAKGLRAGFGGRRRPHV